MSDETIIVVLSDKEIKKHSVRYNSESPKLSSIYIPKAALLNAFDEFPDVVVVTISRKE